MKRLLLLVAMAALVAANPCIAAELPVVGDIPPGISLPNLDGKNVSLSEFSGKPVILTFFTSWSGSCQEELKLLQEISTRCRPSLEVVAISFDKKLTPLKEYVNGQKLSLNFLMDKKLSTLNKYSVLIIPTTIAIGKDGKIKSVLVDYDDNVKKSLQDFIKSEM